MANVVDPYTAGVGAVIAAAELNARIAAILAQVNGNIDAANIAAGSVTKAKLASDALQAFPQLATPATVKTAFGSVAPGGWGGNDHIDFTITHNLNNAAARVVITAAIIDTFTPNVTGDCVVASIVSRALNSVTVRLRASQGGFSNNAPAVDWAAYS